MRNDEKEILKLWKRFSKVYVQSEVNQKRLKTLKNLVTKQLIKENSIRLCEKIS